MGTSWEAVAIVWVRNKKGCPRVEVMWSNKDKEELDLGDQWNVRFERKRVRG